MSTVKSSRLNQRGLFVHQLYGRRAAWEDPAKWVMESFPWVGGPQQHDWPPLLQLRPEDVGFDGYSLAREGSHSKQDTQGEADSDPLVRHPAHVASECPVRVLSAQKCCHATIARLALP